MKKTLRSLLTRQGLTQLFKVGLIGIANTFVYFLLLNVFRWGLGWSSFWSITAGFALTTGMSYVLNRTWTFRLGVGGSSVRESLSFAMVNLGAWAVTVGLLRAAESWLGALGVLELNAVSLVAAGVLIVPKFLSYRDLVFRQPAGNLSH